MNIFMRFIFLFAVFATANVRSSAWANSVVNHTHPFFNSLSASEANGNVTYGNPKPKKGDVNLSGTVDISDVVAIINCIAGISTEFKETSDVSGDGAIDITDIVMVINIIAGNVEPDDPAVEAGICPDNNHPHVIDMGDLGQWSCCNVGAQAPWEYGGHYAWGEVSTKDFYDWSTYTQCKGSYNNCYDLGPDIAGTAFDAAQAVMGGKWCMPSQSQLDLLVTIEKYRYNESIGSYVTFGTTQWYELNGVKGWLLSHKNGNKIFLPAAGRKIESYHWDEGQLFYWTSTLYSDWDYLSMAYRFYKREDYTNFVWDERRYGYSIRPVIGNSIKPDNPDDPAVLAGICPNSNHPHIIDMGSAGKWACCNVGAEGPWEYGGLYAWGETATKESYSWSNYAHCDGSAETVHYLGRNIAGTKYDAATAAWQSKWAMPSFRQLVGLIDLEMQWTELNGAYGWKITASNGNKIFVPKNPSYNGAHYWSASLQKDDVISAKSIYFDDLEWKTTMWKDDRFITGASDRYLGLAIRPAYGADKSDPEDIEPDEAAKENYCPDNNHPHVIDMGAAGKWACCNIGASAPWETGGYYCWGGTKELSFYGATTENETAYLYVNEEDGSEFWTYKWGMWNDQGVLHAEYDVARKSWGGSWYMPTIERFMKLNSAGFTKEGTKLNGTPGLKVTAANGNRIFIPYCGQKRDDKFYYDIYTPLEYWTTNATTTYQEWCIMPDAIALHHNYCYDPEETYSDNSNTDFSQVHKARGDGLPVRAVQ